MSISSQMLEHAGPSRSSTHIQWAQLVHYRTLLQALGIGIPLILLCAPTIGEFIKSWDNYGGSHGFLVPLIALYLAWLQKPVLQHTPVEPVLGGGFLLLVMATLLLLASQIGGIITTQSVALILLIVGLLLLLCGYDYLKALGFPLAYLMIFLTPVLDDLIDSLKWPFQLLTASMSVSMLQWFGIPVTLENSRYIILPRLTLEVAPECSGAQMLIAVLAIGLPLAYLSLRAWWSRVALVVSSIMMAIVANWIRVTIIGVYAEWGGKELHGPYHILQGIFIYCIAFAFLFTAAWVLGSWERSETRQFLPRRPSPSTGYCFDHAAWSRACWLASITFTAAVLLLFSLDRGVPAIKKDLGTLPATIGEWTVENTQNETALLDLQETDASLMRTYRAANGQRVNLYIAYFTSQRQGKELVGLATAPLHQQAAASDLRVGAVVLPVNHTFIERSYRKIPAIHWYYIDGVSYADRYWAKLATIKQAFMRGRTDGALVLISAEPRMGEGDKQWEAQEEFTSVAFPLLRDYLP